MGLADFLLGKKINTQNAEPSASYGQEVDEYLNTLGSQPYMQNLLNQPKEVGLTLKEYQRGVANGLNYGIPEISKMQDQLKIRKPQTEEEIFSAKLGDFNQPQGMNINVSDVPRQGGVLNNFITGFRENFNNGFSPSNLEPANKSFSTRFGEGVGSLARFANSPGVITAGLVLGTGGGALPALAFGGSATLGNQQHRLNDRMYRDDLIRTGRQYVMNTPEYATANAEKQQAMLDEVDNRINGHRGYVNKDIYRNMIDSQIAQENAAYRRMYYDNQRKQDELNTLLAQQKFNYQQGQDAISNAQEWARINILKNNKINNNLNNLNAVSSQLQRFENTFKNMPNKIESNTLGRLRAATGFQTKEEANFNSQRQLLFNKIARDLGGEKGVLSDQDIKRIEGALPNYTDSYAQKQAKMAAIYDLLNDRLAIEGGKLLAQPNTQDGRQTKNGVKYEVID